MFKVKNNIIVPRFDEIKTHLNHQLTFSPNSTKGSILVGEDFHKFEFDNEGHIFSPEKIEGYDYFSDKSYIGKIEEMKFSPTIWGKSEPIQTEESSAAFDVPNVEKHYKDAKQQLTRLQLIRGTQINPLLNVVKDLFTKRRQKRHRGIDTVSDTFYNDVTNNINDIELVARVLKQDTSNQDDRMKLIESRANSIKRQVSLSMKNFLYDILTNYGDLNNARYSHTLYMTNFPIWSNIVNDDTFNTVMNAQLGPDEGTEVGTLSVDEVIRIYLYNKTNEGIEYMLYGPNGIAHDSEEGLYIKDGSPDRFSELVVRAIQGSVQRYRSRNINPTE